MFLLYKNELYTLKTLNNSLFHFELVAVYSPHCYENTCSRQSACWGIRKTWKLCKDVLYANFCKELNWTNHWEKVGLFSCHRKILSVFWVSILFSMGVISKWLSKRWCDYRYVRDDRCQVILHMIFWWRLWQAVVGSGGYVRGALGRCVVGNGSRGGLIWRVLE